MALMSSIPAGLNLQTPLSAPVQKGADDEDLLNEFMPLFQALDEAPEPLILPQAAPMPLMQNEITPDQLQPNFSEFLESSDATGLELTSPESADLIIIAEEIPQSALQGDQSFSARLQVTEFSSTDPSPVQSPPAPVVKESPAPIEAQVTGEEVSEEPHIILSNKTDGLTAAQPMILRQVTPSEKPTAQEVKEQPHEPNEQTSELYEKSLSQADHIPKAIPSTIAAPAPLLKRETSTDAASFSPILSTNLANSLSQADRPPKNKAGFSDSPTKPQQPAPPLQGPSAPPHSSIAALPVASLAPLEPTVEKPTQSFDFVLKSEALFFPENNERLEGALLQRQKIYPAAHSQISRFISSSAPGVTEITLKPEELGKITITFTGDQDRLIVTLNPERKGTLDFLRREVDKLITELRQSGYQEVEVHFDQSKNKEGRRPPKPITLEELDFLNPAPSIKVKSTHADQQRSLIQRR